MAERAGRRYLLLRALVVVAALVPVALAAPHGRDRPDAAVQDAPAAIVGTDQDTSDPAGEPAPDPLPAIAEPPAAPATVPAPPDRVPTSAQSLPMGTVDQPAPGVAAGRSVPA